MAEERLQKLIARSGLCSRREADRMIEAGRVTVNGRVAAPGDRADAERDHVKVKGRLLKPPEPLRYLLLYKPRGVMTTCDDPEQRTTVLDLVRPVVKQRVFPVGRLDYHSEGLLVLTNDGELAARLTHPRHGVVREYLVKVRGDLTPEEQRALMRGASIDGVPVRPRRLRRQSVTKAGGNSWWQIEVTEGRTHEVRELFFRVGHPVQRLRRTAIGPLRDDQLRPGELRFLSEAEVEALERATRRRQVAHPAGRHGARSDRPDTGSRRSGAPRSRTRAGNRPR